MTTNNNDSTYKVAIIGGGNRARFHVRAYGKIDKAQVVAVCDLNAEAVNRFAADFGIAGYTDAETMLKEQKPDIVHIVTPPAPAARLPYVRLVGEAGVKGCVIEKPIAVGTADWRELCDIEKTSKTKFVVNHQFRYHPIMVKCHEAIQSGKLGAPLLFDFSARMNISAQGTHNLDYGIYLNGDYPVVSVFGAASGVDEDDAHPAPAITFAEVKFSNGARGIWHSGYTAPLTVDDDTIWKHCRYAVYAEQGRTLYEEFGKWEIVYPDHTEKGVVESEQWDEDNDIAQAALVDSLIDWIEDDAKVSGSSLKLALNEWNIILALYYSAMNHAPVQMPFDPPADLLEKLIETLKN